MYGKIAVWKGWVVSINTMIVLPESALRKRSRCYWETRSNIKGQHAPTWTDNLYHRHHHQLNHSTKCYFQHSFVRQFPPLLIAEAWVVIINIYHHVNVLNIIVITTYNYIILVSHLRCVQGAYNFIFYFRKKKKKEAVSCGILIIIHLHYQCYNDSIIQYINYIRWAGTAIIYILTIPHHSKNSPHAHCISCGMCTNTHRYH